MLLREYLASKCDTGGLAGLTNQIVEKLIATLPADTLIDVAGHVEKSGGSTLTYLQKEAGEALIAAIQEKGEKPKLVHAIRVLPQQYAVYYWFLHGKKCGVKLAAAPSASPHERAIGIDIRNHPDWIKVLKKHKWIWRGQADPPHFTFHGLHDPELNVEAIKAFQRLWNTHNPNDQIDDDGRYGPATEKRLEASPIEGF
jgi:hypothetical protein